MESLDGNHISNIFATLRSLSSIQRRVLPRLLTRTDKLLLLFFITTIIASSTFIVFDIIDTYSTSIPGEGGTLREGIIGIPRFINPLLANSDADRDLTNMIYTGLLRQDGMGNLALSLAKRYTISDDGLMYTFYMHENARWSDGTPLSADDIIFTVSLVKDPNYRSPYRPNWEV